MTPRRHFGKYRGTVTADVDPTGDGRIQVRVPALFGDSEGRWALPCVPYSTGPTALPPVGTQVWVEFEEGDLSHPIWTGA